MCNAIPFTAMTQPATQDIRGRAARGPGEPSSGLSESLCRPTGWLAEVSMDAVAERAAVSKATIYRWWSTKERLALDALFHERTMGSGNTRDTSSLKRRPAPRRELDAGHDRRSGERG